MDPVVIAAFIAAVPATVAGAAAWKAARGVHKEVRTNHGLRQGDYVELTAMVVGELRESFATHVQQDADNFATINEQLAEIASKQ